ncbi:MAG: DUF4232 domain-containing protein [Candidatus Limnocylindrales bacterium]|jgi:hypothetical protein
MAACIALLMAGCATASATPAPAATDTVAAATATPTATPTATATATPAPTDTPAATPTATATPTAKATAATTPLPPLAVGLCKASQLKLVITAWQFDGTYSYAHVTATNKSSSSCNMRGSSEARIADVHGNIIGDAGASAAKVKSTDPIYALAPGGGINTIITWGNWCHAAPAQKVFVAMVQPFGLGGFVSKALGNAPIPTCYSSSMKTQVSSENWLP